MLTLSQVCQCQKDKDKDMDATTVTGGNDCGAYWCLPLTPLRRVTPTMMRVLHILKRISLLPDFCQCITQQSQGILQSEKWGAESEESRISVLPNVVKSRHFGILLKSSHHPLLLASGPSEGNEATCKSFGSSVLGVSKCLRR